MSGRLRFGGWRREQRVQETVALGRRTVPAMRWLTGFPLVLVLAACGGGDGGDAGDSGPEGSEEAVSTLLADARAACGPVVLTAVSGEDSGLGDAVADAWIELGDDGATLTVESPTSSEGDVQISAVAMHCALNETDAPYAVTSQVEQTTALEGRQEISWEGIDLSWSYHPNNGVSAVFTLAD